MFHRYIQGARFFGNSNDANVDGEVVIDSTGITTTAAAPVASELVVPASQPLRSRFVGQGYKQVKEKSHKISFQNHV